MHLPHLAAGARCPVFAPVSEVQLCPPADSGAGRRGVVCGSSAAAGRFWSGLGLRDPAKLPQVNNLIRVADYDYVTMTRTNPAGSVLLQGMSANC